jgi:glycosyltransferase involved in cell wall biosynthesis
LPVLTETAKASLVAASDLLVLPSRHEAFGTVFLEAWALGTPVVGADIPSVREVLGAGGLVFRPDDAGDMAARIDEALGDPGRRRALAARGREQVLGRHTWDRVGAAVRDAYARTRAGARERRALAARKGLSWG